MTDTATLAPLTKQVHVPCDPTRAFQVFTEELRQWWPIDTHSIGGDDVDEVVIEPRVGGRVYELLRSGECAVWGDVLIWDPPARFVMTWHPGTPAEEATELELRFTPTTGGTQVDLEHRGWERRIEDGAAMRSSYDTGWDMVIERYVDAAATMDE